MALPELPKKNERREALIDDRVAKWFKNNHPHSVLLEVKMVGDRVTENQQRLIDSVSRTGKFKYKFPDGGRRTPLDYVIVKNCDAALCYCDKSGRCECTINKVYPINIKV